jgi:hypothetical protein
MSSSETSGFHLPKRDHVRLAAMALAAAEIVFWLYAFFYISRHASPGGDGLEWAAMLPLTLIWLCLAFPALVLSPFARAAWIAAGLATAAAVADLVIWTQVLGEFAAKAG